METFGKHQCVGYDIGCTFSATLRDSPALSQRVRDLFLELILNAFHGYTHNRLCQLQYHPLFRANLGLEDLESCERVFSSSNAVARIIRHASPFHWKQSIDLHFMQWNEDRQDDIST
jgi:hypothetical protein